MIVLVDEKQESEWLILSEYEKDRCSELHSYCRDSGAVLHRLSDLSADRNCVPDVRRDPCVELLFAPSVSGGIRIPSAVFADSGVSAYHREFHDRTVPPQDPKTVACGVHRLCRASVCVPTLPYRGMIRPCGRVISNSNHYHSEDSLWTQARSICLS